MSFSDELKSFPADEKSKPIIRRWLKFADVDGVWEKMVQAEARHYSPSRLNAKEFIRLVLSAPYGVQRLIDHEAAVKEQFSDLKTEFVKWVQVAESPRDIEDAIGEFKPRFEILDRSIYDFHARTPVSRKDQNGSRARTAFAVRVRTYLQRNCGTSLDEQVIAPLMYIVFGRADDDGRAGNRPTTKAGRARREK